MKRTFAALALTTAFAALAAPAIAQSQGDWTFGVGVANVNPKSDNGTLAGSPSSIGDDTQLSLTAEYFIRDNLGIELLAATPFEHDINIGGSFAGTTRQLPPTLSLNYHPPTKGKIKPFFGLGLNYTTFFEEASPLGVLELDDSWGYAVQVGADWQISDHGAVRLNLRYIDIDSDATLNGAPIGTAEIDPIVVGVSYVHRF
ncbi:OmpW/AlkL family protein [Parasedimentitalea huanghaiensis]|uniref:Outer membrane beta-barrel protein n=1 Tax=Parasedimentitalea huanghaiensis TaxID=2682100 RepID=A0A6L6WJE1_9RHOB|nr:OmpW family outer membrane protein [Zongyanglinia huanghaiensis]MVO15842.1 outer membrane beta-barrel protein [Zongyanglinia huanghaiensis]